jgi:hypothetical protein
VHFDVFPANRTILVKKFVRFSKCVYSQLYGRTNKSAQLTTNQRAETALRMKTEMVFETSVSTKAEPHYPAENSKELHENGLVRRENIKMRL